MAILAAIGERNRAKSVVRLAVDVATAYDETLVALHVVPEDDFVVHRAAIESLSGFSITQNHESAEQFARKFVLETVDEIDPDQFLARGRVGDVTTEVLAEASELDPRFLVISGRRVSPVGKAVFGNTAQQILVEAECPVITHLSGQ